MIRYKYEKQIAALLLKNECVVIPEVGGFIVYSIAAEINIAERRIIPPGKKLRFHAGLKDDNNLLANAVAAYYDIHPESAKSIVFSESKSLLAKFESGEKLIIKGVGDIRKENGELFFEPCPIQESVICPELGLQSVDLPAAIIKLRTEEPVKEEVIVAAPVNNKKNKNWLKIAASFALPLCFGVGMLMESSSNNFLADFGSFNSAKSEYAQRGYFPTEIKVAKEIKATEDVTIATAGISTIEGTDIAVALPVKESAALKYQIIGGCFKDLGNANDAVQNFKMKGFDAFISEKKNGLYRVCVGKYTNRKDATAAIAKAKKELNLNLWFVKS